MQDMRSVKWNNNVTGGSTGGCFLKYTDGKRFYKLSAYQEVSGIYGFESILEVVISRYCDILQIPHINYDGFEALVSIDGIDYSTYICYSHNYMKDGYTKQTYELVCKLRGFKLSTPVENFKIINEWDSYCMFALLDFLIINRDRHSANIEFMVKGDDVKIIPPFDHGCSLIALYFDDVERALNMNNMHDFKVNSCLVTDRSLYSGLVNIKENSSKPITLSRIERKDVLYTLFDETMCKYLPDTAYVDKIVNILWERYQYAKDQKIFIER